LLVTVFEVGKFVCVCFGVCISGGFIEVADIFSFLWENSYVHIFYHIFCLTQMMWYLHRKNSLSV